jgi:hypothetical protein
MTMSATRPLKLFAALEVAKGYAADKHPTVRAWLERNPRVTRGKHTSILGH